MRRHADGCTAPPINAGRHIAATVGPVAAMRITSVHELLQRYLPTRPRVANCLNHRGRHRREGHAHDRGQDTTPACAGPPSALIGRCRMGGRAVEGTGLENRQACKRLVGSNPTPSAISRKPFLEDPDERGSADLPEPDLFQARKEMPVQNLNVDIPSL